MFLIQNDDGLQIYLSIYELLESSSYMILCKLLLTNFLKIKLSHMLDIPVDFSSTNTDTTMQWSEENYAMSSEGKHDIAFTTRMQWSEQTMQYHVFWGKT